MTDANMGECGLTQLKQLNDKFMKDPFVIENDRQRFYYYTQRSTAGKILNGGKEHNTCFWISSLAEMNDQQESDWHVDEKDRIYALCFCNTDAESIPMWYLYSGIDGEGIRIAITPKKMLSFIASISKVYPVYDATVDRKHPLTINDDFVLEYGWVYYVGHKNVIYNNKTYARLDKNDKTNEVEFGEFLKNNYFVKDYEWNYEKEFRIVFRLKDNYSVVPPKRIALFFDKDELMKKNGGLSAMAAPELKNKSKDELARELGLPEKKISNSRLNIRMSLINRNAESIVKSFFDITNAIYSIDQLDELSQKIEYRKEQLQ